MGGNRLLDRQPGDLVPELQPVAVAAQQPGRGQLIDGGRPSWPDRLKQP
jgi:hypothetical protein